MRNLIEYFTNSKAVGVFSIAVLTASITHFPFIKEYFFGYGNMVLVTFALITCVIFYTGYKSKSVALWLAFILLATIGNNLFFTCVEMVAYVEDEGSWPPAFNRALAVTAIAVAVIFLVALVVWFKTKKKSDVDDFLIQKSPILLALFSTYASLVLCALISAISAEAVALSQLLFIGLAVLAHAKFDKTVERKRNEVWEYTHMIFWNFLVNQAVLFLWTSISVN